MDDGGDPDTELLAATEAGRLVAEVRDDVRGRLALATRLYERHARLRPYHRAQLAFMRWQAVRGVLDPPGAPRPGSPWWRAVNEVLLRDGWEAATRLDGGAAPSASPSRSVDHWTRFLRHPSPAAWYRAHNASVVAGYLAHRELAAAEHEVERFFADVALVRVFFAHSLVGAPGPGWGPLRPGARLLADPRRAGTGWFLSLRNILPRRYPLDDVAIGDVLRAEHRLGRLVDYGLIVPRIPALYEFAAADIGEPEVLTLLRDGAPSYAWPAGRPEVWDAPGRLERWVASHHGQSRGVAEKRSR